MSDFELIDTHSHLNHKDFNDDLPAVLDRASDAGIVAVVVPGYDLESSERAVELATSHREIYATVGIHPHDAKILDPSVISRMRQLANSDKVVGYGEIGLDFHYNFSPPETQKEAFAVQLGLANELDLPLVIHTREADTEIIDILKREGVGPRGGVMHHFSGDPGFSSEVLKLSLFIGLAGIITFKKNDPLRQTVRGLTLDSILVETDAPYAAPHPMRGKRNEPAYVRLVAERIAELLNMSREDVAAATTANARRLFSLS